MFLLTTGPQLILSYLIVNVSLDLKLFSFSPVFRSSVQNSQAIINALIDCFFLVL